MLSGTYIIENARSVNGREVISAEVVNGKVNFCDGITQHVVVLTPELQALLENIAYPTGETNEPPSTLCFDDALAAMDTSGVHIVGEKATDRPFFADVNWWTLGTANLPLKDAPAPRKDSPLHPANVERALNGLGADAPDWLAPFIRQAACDMGAKTSGIVIVNI